VANGSISSSGASAVSQCETEEPISTGAGAYIRTCPLASPPVRTCGAQALTAGPVQCRFPVSVADPLRCASVPAGQAVPEKNEIVFEGAAAPTPYHQVTPDRQPGLSSTSLLKAEPMSLASVSRSEPARLFASALGYQVVAMGAFAKSRKTALVPARPRTPAVAEQGVSGSITASTVIGTGLFRIASQTSAAARNAFMRCSPRVVPALPATGATGVVSLKRSFGPSPLTITICAAAKADETSTDCSPALSPKTENGTGHHRLISDGWGSVEVGTAGAGVSPRARPLPPCVHGASLPSPQGRPWRRAGSGSGPADRA
jgi:hypothetical protein